MIVSFFEKISDYFIFRGNGFVEQQGLLISAAHIFLVDNEIKVSSFFIKWQEKMFNISDELVVFMEFKEKGEYTKDDDFYKDLIIIKFPFLIPQENFLKLGVSNVGFNDLVTVKGYCESGKNLEEIKGKVNFASKVSATFNEDPKNTKLELTFLNCFRIDENLVPGFSGSPVFLNSEVVGLIVLGPKTENKFNNGIVALKSEYILNCLKCN